MNLSASIASTPLQTAEAAQDWAAYFAYNAAHQMAHNWSDEYRLTEIERHTILSSIQQFQVGENSDGRQLIRRAKAYAERSGDHAYLPALMLFIQEEQRHSTYLKRFMEQQGLPLLTGGHWVDDVFRRVRHLANLEMSIAVLLMAEVIAMTYYRGLRGATGSPLLRGICRQLLRDEVQHLKFQSETLGKLRRGRAGVVSGAVHWAERGLFAGILLVVWQQHGQVYRAGGFGFRRYWAANWRRFERTFGGTHG